MSTTRQKPTFFVYGLSGSGKDTIANFLWNNYGYRKMRIAKTIKLVVCETNNLEPEELEIRKREKPLLRKQHKDVSDYMDENCRISKHNLNRLQMLIDEKSYDYEVLTKTEIENKAPKVFIDVRSYDEAHMLLKSGAIGIFLMRGSDNDVNKSHWTEKSMFAPNKKKSLPSQMVQLMYEFDKQCFVVDNSKTKEITISTNNYLTFDVPNITGEILCEAVDSKIFSNLIL